MQLLDQRWYKDLIEECGAIITEAEFISRWSLVEGYHQLGKRLLEENENFERANIYGKEIASCVSQSLHKSKRTVERSIQFARKYPDLNLLPEGKDTSWYKIVNKYLPEPRQQEPQEEPENLIECPFCHKRFNPNFSA